MPIKSAPGIFPNSSSQAQSLPPTSARGIRIDEAYYTQVTDELLDAFYPKFCCNERLTAVDGKRDTVLRCPHCHKQKTRLAGTPLHHLKLPRWMFGYLLKESQLQYPKVLTITEIAKRVGVSYPAAMRLKRRLQLFAADTIPRMQRKFYETNKLRFQGFRFPRDREVDLKPLIADKPVPQADTVVLYSCRATANKGRKRYRRSGQTASIYRSESLGGDQIGTLAHTMAVKQGPVFYDSIPNQKAETIFPILGKYNPHHGPLFTDMGYRGFTSMNHRMVNHSRKSSDKRYKWARNRWSKNGVHCNVAEGKNGILKRSFGSYGWINPRHSNLYLQEYAFNANLRHFALEDLLPEESNPAAIPGYRLDDNWAMRGLVTRVLPEQDSNLRRGG